MIPNRDSILGVDVDILSMSELNELVEKKIDSNEKCFITNHNLHSVYLYHNDPKFKKAYEYSFLTHIDGMPLVLLGKITGKRIEKQHRITYLDWLSPLLNLLNKKGCKLYYLGSKEGIAQKAVDKLQLEYPNIQFKVRHGYFELNSSDEFKILNEINDYQPNVLMVGMGMPRQEKWVSANFNQLPDSVILPCGACFDYLAGEVRTPPRWLGKIYLEWLYRFIFEPKRLFRRYFIEPIYLLPFVLRDVMKRQK